jgi:hypothetical protein
VQGEALLASELLSNQFGSHGFVRERSSLENILALPDEIFSKHKAHHDWASECVGLNGWSTEKPLHRCKDICLGVDIEIKKLQTSK